MTQPPNPADDHHGVRQIVVHPAAWPALEAWLTARGIALCLLPLDGDDLPTYVMQPSADLMTAARSAGR